MIVTLRELALGPGSLSGTGGKCRIPAKVMDARGPKVNGTLKAPKLGQLPSPNPLSRFRSSMTLLYSTSQEVVPSWRFLIRLRTS